MSNKNIFAIIEIILAILFIVGCSIIGLGIDIKLNGIIGLGIGMAIIGGIGAIAYPIAKFG